MDTQPRLQTMLNRALNETVGAFVRECPEVTEATVLWAIDDCKTDAPAVVRMASEDAA